MQDTTVPMEGMDGEEPVPGPMEDSPGGIVSDAPEAVIPADSGESTGGEFPAGDDMPFDGVSDGDVPLQDAPPGEFPIPDGFSPGGDEGDVPTGPSGSDAEGDEADYDAFLAEMGQGGMEPVPLPDGADGEEDEGEGGGQGDGPGEVPPVPQEDQLDNPPAPEAPGADGPGTADDPAPARVIDRRTTPRRERERVLTIDPRAEVLTQQDLEDLVWHELENAQRTGHILTGKLSAVERTRNGMDTAVIMFKDVQVLVPLREMGVHTGPVPSGPDYVAWVLEMTKRINARQNSDVDFVVRGFGFNEASERIVAGSRRDAMRRKRKRFYLDTDELGNHLIEEGRLVQARVLTVGDKNIRLEVFGVECVVSARWASRVWVSDVRSKYSVGDLVTVRVTKIERDKAGGVEIQVDARDVFGRDEDKLCLCQRNGRYVGEVTDVRGGVFFVRLSIGVNAISHECRDVRMPGRKDTVSLTVTRLDEKNGVAFGIINRIIKQNL